MRDVKIIVKGLEVKLINLNKTILEGNTKIKLEKDLKLKVVKKLTDEVSSLEDVVVMKQDENLVIQYLDNSSIVVESFFTVENMQIELPIGESEIYSLSSSSYMNSSESIIYLQGDYKGFEAMFKGNETILDGLESYAYNTEINSLNASTPSAAGAEGVAVGGLSTTAYVAAGVVGVGAVAVAAGGGSGGSSSSGSSSSGSDSSGASSSGGITLSSARLVDSHVSGVKVYKNGVEVSSTNHDGYFNYSGTTGDRFEFMIGQTSIGVMNFEDIPADGIITIQDLVGVNRNETDDADVVVIAQFLQTLDADGDADNGIQIITDANGDVVTGITLDSNTDSEVTAQEIATAQAALTGAEEVILDVSEGSTDTSIDNATNLNALIEAGDASGGVNTAVDAATAEAHLNDSLQDMYTNDGYTFVSNLSELNTAIADASITKIVVTGSINFWGLDMSGFTNVVVNNFDSSSALSLTMSPAQINSFSLESAFDDGVTALVEVGDTDLRNYDLSGISGLNLNGLSVIATVAQTQGVSITTGGGSFEVIDSIANLTGNITGISAATQVTAVLPSDGSITDLSAITLDNDVTAIDLNGQTDVLATFAQAALATNGTTLVKDTAANIIAEGNIGSTNVIISDAVTISDLQTIKNNTTGTVDASVAGVFDTAYNIWNDGGTTVMDVRFEIDGGATLAQLATIDSNKGNNGTLVYDLIEDTGSNLYNGATANNPFITGDVDVTITAASTTISTIAALDPLTTGVITASVLNVNQGQVSAFQNTNVNGNNEIAITLGAGYTTATASEMLTLLSATSSTITATSLTSINGSGTDLITLGNASNFDVSNSLRVIGFPNISVSHATTLDGLFASPIVGTISEGDINSLVTLTDANNNNELTINLTSPTVTAYALQLVNDITTVEVNAQSVSTIIGSYSDLTNLNTSAGNNEIEVASSLNLTVNFDTSLTVTQIDTLNTIATNVLDLSGITEISGDIADLINLDYEYDQGNVLLNSNVEITVNDDFNRAEFNVISNMTNADIVVGAGASLVDGLLTGIDLSNYSGLKNLTSLDVTANTNGDSTISLTAADIFAANDNTGDLTFDITGTNGGSDTVELSTAEGWTDQGGGTYTVTGNFDGVAGNETYTLNLTDVAVTMIA